MLYVAISAEVAVVVEVTNARRNFLPAVSPGSVGFRSQLAGTTRTSMMRTVAVQTCGGDSDGERFQPFGNGGPHKRVVAICSDVYVLCHRCRAGGDGQIPRPLDIVGAKRICAFGDAAPVPVSAVSSVKVRSMLAAGSTVIVTGIAVPSSAW